ncbi:MAG: hypothetical protein QOG75_676 [Mycobacterium sp.]|jgi:hypothetical protein|nr:hypothetical protein [Mycobacterium sp.]
MPQNIPTKPTTSKALTASYLSQWIASVVIVWPAVVEIFCSAAERVKNHGLSNRLPPGCRNGKAAMSVVT